jgi:hypothetical protein
MPKTLPPDPESVCNPITYLDAQRFYRLAVRYDHPALVEFWLGVYSSLRPKRAPEDPLTV